MTKNKLAFYKSDLLLIGFIFTVKIIIVYWYSTVLFIQSPLQCIKHLVFIGGDTASYLDPVNNYISSGKYFFINEKLTPIFIGRGPYYGIPYYIFRLFLNVNNAYVALGALQFILDCISTFILYKLLEVFAKKSKYLTLVKIFILLVIPVTALTIHLTTESMSMSLSMISLWFFLKFLENKKMTNFWYSSIISCWVFCLKPYLIPLGFIFFLVCFLNDKMNYMYWCKRALIYYIPLLIIITPYTIRNWTKYDRVVPFQDLYAGYGYNKADLSIRKFIQSFGGSIIFWDQNAAGSFFTYSPRIGTKFEFPKYSYASCYNLDSLKEIAISYKILNNQNPQNESLINEISLKMDNYTNCLKNENPYLFYVKSRVELFNRFVLKNGPYFLPRNNLFQLLLKVLQVILYYCMIISCLICTLLIIFRVVEIPLSVILATIGSWYPLILFPIFLKSDEWRYIDTAYPFLMLLTGYLFLKITSFSYIEFKNKVINIFAQKFIKNN